MRRTIHHRRPRRHGFTLLELTLGISLGLAVAAMTLSLANQQFSFLRIFRAQEFLSTEAPVVNNFVIKLVGGADGFRLHNSISDAESGVQPVMTDASVLVLRHRQADGVVRESALAFTDVGSGPGLYFYLVPTNGVFGDPEWAVSTKPQNVVFSLEQGILRMRMTGPNGEEITYSGAIQL